MKEGESPPRPRPLSCYNPRSRAHADVIPTPPSAALAWDRIEAVIKDISGTEDTDA